jgi:hypothetical protein
MLRSRASTALGSLILATVAGACLQVTRSHHAAATTAAIGRIASRAKGKVECRVNLLIRTLGSTVSTPMLIAAATVTPSQRMATS